MDIHSDSFCEPHVLLVEDDASLGRTTCDLLKLFGYRVSWSATAADAVSALCSNEKFNGVLLDYSLDGATGVDVIQRTKARGCHIPPIIIFSSHPPDVLASAREVTNAAAVLRKPCPAHTLREVLENVVTAP